LHKPKVLRAVSNHKINVIGASHGGVAALERIVSDLQPDLNAAVLVVLHIGSASRSPTCPKFSAALAARPSPGHDTPSRSCRVGVYIAPPDQRMLLEQGYVRTVHSPKEHHTRPAVDPLFRSPALVFGEEVIGVVLTGNLRRKFYNRGYLQVSQTAPSPLRQLVQHRPPIE
jgi:two-component system chemotaxis response regulator CheB